MFYYSGREDKHEHGVGFLVPKDTIKSIMRVHPLSSRICTILLRASPFNAQVCAPTPDYDDKQVEHFYNNLMEVVDQTSKKDVSIVFRDWNAKVGKDTYKAATNSFWQTRRDISRPRR